MKKKLKTTSIKRRSIIQQLINDIQYVPIKVDDNDKLMYQTLIREFPELEKIAIFKADDNIGLVFTPAQNRHHWRSLKEIFLEYLPEINRRIEERAYDNLIKNYLDNEK